MGTLEGTRFAWEKVARDHELVSQMNDRDFWVKYLSDNQDMMYRLLADLHQASAVMKGQDPKRLPTVEELRALVTHSYSNEPFGPALKKALGPRRGRWLAGRLGMHHSQIARLISGEKEIVLLNDPQESMRRIEAISRELRVHPSYFAEWRRLWVMNLIDGMFEIQPHLSIGMWKKFAGVPDKVARSDV